MADTNPVAAEKLKSIVLIVMPSFGQIDTDIVLNLLTQVPPIFKNFAYYFPRNMTVAEARNEAFKLALELDAEYVFFRDYDVVAPLNSLGLLLARDHPLVGGLYYSKEFPPWPLTMKNGTVTTDWKFGETVECDVIGMGCTLIKVDLFRDMPPPWFATLSGVTEDKNVTFRHTEDTYFCRRVIAEKGIHPYIDTALNCVHIDLETRAQFFYDPARGIGVMQDKTGTFAVDPINPHRYVCDVTKEDSSEEDNGVSAPGPDAVGAA